jgi:hypothetical protein
VVVPVEPVEPVLPDWVADARTDELVVVVDVGGV